MLPQNNELKQNEKCYVVLASLREDFEIDAKKLKKIIDNPPTGVDDITDCVFPNGAEAFKEYSVRKPTELVKPFSSSLCGVAIQKASWIAAPNKKRWARNDDIFRNNL